MARGFVYPVAAMASDFCVDTRENMIDHYGIPEIFNIDQGAQLPNTAFSSVLKHNDIKISMGGKDRRVDNVFIPRLA